MSIGLIDDAGVEGRTAPDTVAAAGVILPALAYGDADFVDVVLPAGAWTSIAVRDIQRAAVVIFHTPGSGVVNVRSGGNAVAVPFIIADTDNGLTLRYVDFLTVVTGDLFAFSAAGTTITVGSVRRQ